MSASQKNLIRSSNAQAKKSGLDEFETDVLFQKIYDKWYAFTIVDDDCLMTEVPETEVQKRMSKKFSFAA